MKLETQKHFTGQAGQAEVGKHEKEGVFSRPFRFKRN
jgi:hypothetical protein